MSIAAVTKLERISRCAALGCALWLAACNHTSEQMGGLSTPGQPASGSAAPAAGSGVTLAQAGRTAPGAGGSTATAGSSAGGLAGSGPMTAAAGSGAAGAAGNAAAAGSGGGAGAAGSAQAGAGGSAGTGAAGSAGAAGGSATGMHAGCSMWPAPSGDQQVSSTIQVMGTLDGKLKRYIGSGSLGGSGQDEGQGPIFELADGATLENVIIGAPAADGIHCKGSCTLRNVWWQDVGEDAATLLGSSASQTMKIECGGAKSASDKVFQHNGPGTMIISNFDVQDFGKLYRSCGNCKTQYERHVEVSQITAKGGKSTLVGINSNYNDTARLKDITINDPNMKLTICERFKGNNSGAEPTKEGTGPDAKNCLYMDSDIKWQ